VAGTGWAPAIIRRMRDNGVIPYLTKPLNLTELGQLLDAQLAGRKAAQTAASPAPASGVAFENAGEVNAGGEPGADDAPPPATPRSRWPSSAATPAGPRWTIFSPRPAP
jgi:hypothetical protein